MVNSGDFCGVSVAKMKYSIVNLTSWLSALKKLIPAKRLSLSLSLSVSLSPGPGGPSLQTLGPGF